MQHRHLFKPTLDINPHIGVPPLKSNYIQSGQVYRYLYKHQTDEAGNIKTVDGLI